MDDGMNDDIAASRTTPRDQKQQKPGTTDRRLSDSHFQGFGHGHHGHGLFSKDGKIGKHFATEETAGEHAGGKAAEPKSNQRVDRSEMYGGYGA